VWQFSKEPVMNLEAVKKELSVFVLLIMLVLMDYLKIDDVLLKSLLMGLAASISGYGGLMGYNASKGAPPSSQ
jgi:hypothetical protein